ncbi:hypothetical protein OUZ56_011518 [Daphnia magna]|uniref:Uncharacterized protein n=1 Tax=Daphnia magna TaxID=35525 RepID=A0ABQ9Z0C3_9CRUS|nr:hypothetical protein OUZ56_011518 [Daphnia magna]
MDDLNHEPLDSLSYTLPLPTSVINERTNLAKNGDKIDKMRNYIRKTDRNRNITPQIIRKAARLAINLYFVYNINISLKSVFEIHGANLPHYHCQLTPLVGHKPEKELKKFYQLAPPSPMGWIYWLHEGTHDNRNAPFLYTPLKNELMVD